MGSLLRMSALGFAGYGLLLPIAPLWAVHGGADEAGAGLVNAVLLFATILGQMCVPWALRRVGWRAMLVSGMLLLGLPAFALAMSAALPWLLAWSAVRGIGFAILTVCGASAVAELVDASRRGRAIGLYGLSIAAPQFFLMPAAAWVAHVIDIRILLVLGAAPVLAVPFAATLGRRLDAKTTTLVADSDSPPVSRGRVMLALLVPSLCLLAVTTPGGALLTFTPQLAPSAATAFYGLTAFTGMAALARWLIGSVADRFGPGAFIPPLLLVGAGGLALCAWSISEGGPGAGGLVVGMAVAGVSYGAIQNLTLVAAFAAVPARDRGVASAVWNLGFDAGTGLGALAVGVIAAGTSFSAGLLVTSVACAAAAAAMLAGSVGRRWGRTGQ